MELGLKGRRALIVGGSRSIGKTIALALGEEGCDIILTGREESDLIEACSEITGKTGLKASHIVFNVFSDNPYGNFLAEFQKRTNCLDILVNAIGGVSRAKRFHELEIGDWKEMYEFNLFGPAEITRLVLPILVKSDQSRIINIASISARQPGWSNPDYISSKAAMINLSKYWANEYGKFGLTSNVICPASFTGEGWERIINDRAKRENISVEEARRVLTQEQTAKTVLDRLGTPEDIANLVVFLASSKAGYITGTCIGVDGGASKDAF